MSKNNVVEVSSTPFGEVILSFENGDQAIIYHDIGGWHWGYGDGSMLEGDSEPLATGVVSDRYGAKNIAVALAEEYGLGFEAGWD